MQDRKEHHFFLFRSNDKGEFVGNQQHIFERKLQCLHQTYLQNHNKEGQKFHNLSFYLPKKWEKPHFLSTKISFLSEQKHSVTAFCLSATYFLHQIEQLPGSVYPKLFSDQPYIYCALFQNLLPQLFPNICLDR